MIFPGFPAVLSFSRFSRSRGIPKVSLLLPANIVCEGYVFRGVCLSTGGGIPACLAGHMTRQQYISRCTVDVSQLVWRQHTGNIKCMMG